MGTVRHIFQTWKTHQVPKEWSQGQRSVQEMNPTFTYKLFNHAEMEMIVRQYMPSYLHQYLAFTYDIERCDAFRYIYLYLFGGIYLDLDYHANLSFDTILKAMGTSVIGLTRSGYITASLSNSILIARRPGHPFFKKLIDETMQCPTALFGKHIHVMRHTGPWMITNVYNRLDDQSDIAILTNIVQPCNSCSIASCQRDPNYTLTPLYGKSWNSWDSHLIEFLFCKRWILMLMICIGIILFRYS
jgi:mannosyltransferase OCH1-like enzyme